MKEITIKPCALCGCEFTPQDIAFTPYITEGGKRIWTASLGCKKCNWTVSIPMGWDIPDEDRYELFAKQYNRSVENLKEENTPKKDIVGDIE